MTGTTPNLFVIGAPRCGTTALSEYLRSHPRVFFSQPKEPRFWCSDLESNPRAERWAVDTYDLAQYLELFKQATAEHSIVAEGSTLYLSSKIAISRILDFNSAAKFIVMVRRPAELFQSWHSYLMRQFQEDVEDPQRAWDLQAERSAGKTIPARCDVPAKLQYRDIIALGGQMQRLFEAVPRNRVHVIFYEDFRANPSRVYSRTLEFLGLPHDGRTEFPQINEAFSYRVPWLARGLLSPPLPLLRGLRLLRKHLPSASLPSPRHQALLKLRVRAEKAPLPTPLVQTITNELGRDVRVLGELLDRDLTHWLTQQRASSPPVPST